MTDFSQRVADLQARIDNASAKYAKSKCMPTALLIGLAVPIIVGLVLYIFKFKFVSKKDEAGDMVRDTKKIFIYTLVITAVAWAILYGVVQYYGDQLSLICKI